MKFYLLAMVMILGAATSARGAAPLRIGYVTALANAPVLIAERQGYFARQRLAVTLIPFGDGPLIQQAVASGQLDVAYIGAPPVYQWYARGLDMRILAKVNSGQAAIVVKTNGPIKNLADLRGRKLAGVSRGSGMDVLLRGVVLRDIAKLKPDIDISLVQIPVASMNAALDTGIVDAVFEWEPFVSQSVLRGTGRVLLDADQALPGYPAYVIAAQVKTLQERPDDIVKLLRAHHQAIEFLNSQPAAANQIVAASFKLAPVQSAGGKTIPPDAIVAEARKRIGWFDRIEPTDRGFIQRMMDQSLALGFLQKPLTVAQVTDDSFQIRAIGAGK